MMMMMMMMMIMATTMPIFKKALLNIIPLFTDFTKPPAMEQLKVTAVGVRSPSGRSKAQRQ